MVVESGTPSTINETNKNENEYKKYQANMKVYVFLPAMKKSEKVG